MLTGRKLLGETNPANSAPGTIRGDFAVDIGRCVLLIVSSAFDSCAHLHPFEQRMRLIGGILSRRNVCHGSDAVDSAQREIGLWFPEGLADWQPTIAAWVYEK